MPQHDVLHCPRCSALSHKLWCSIFRQKTKVISDHCSTLRVICSCYRTHIQQCYCGEKRYCDLMCITLLFLTSMDLSYLQKKKSRKFFSVRLLFCVPFLSPKVGLEKKCVWLVTVQEATWVWRHRCARLPLVCECQMASWQPTRLPCWLPTHRHPVC